MALINVDELNDLKSKVNIVDLISQYVALSKNGKNYLGLCPFHGEKTPSFNVNAEKGFYHCFGCGKSGDAIEFIKEYKQVGFKDALLELAEFAGIQLNIEQYNTHQDNPNQILFDINNQAARLYHIILMSTELGTSARQYLLERGIDEELIKRFNIGLAPDETDFLYRSLSPKFEEKVMANSGLFHFSNQKTFDAFSNRIMFPITNEYGQTIGFSGRKWQENDLSKAKYINSTQTPVFDKSYELWNLDKAKPTISKNHEVYLMEGFMDVIAAFKAGVNNVVASMGTALTEKHVNRLRQSVKHFVLVYDGDSAGQNAINKAIKLIGEDSVSIVKIPEGLDPDEYEKHYGAVELARLLQENRIQPIEFFIDFLKPSNLSHLQAQIDFIDQIAPMIASVQSITAQDAFIRKLVEILPDFEYNQVENAVNLRRENVRDNSQSTVPFNEPYYPDDFSAPPAVEPNEFNQTGMDSPQFLERKFNQKEPSLLLPKRSSIEIVEEQLIHRMIYHNAVLKRFANDQEFHFVHQNYQALFDKLMIEAMSFDGIDPNHFASELDSEMKSLFYEIIDLDLPDEVSPREINDLVAQLSKNQLKTELGELLKQLETAHKSGNAERELELTVQIINQKKKI